MQSDLIRQRDVRCRTGDKQIEVSRRHSPRMALDIVVGESSPVEFHNDVLGLAGIQAYSLESLQFLYWTGHRSALIANGNGGEAYFAAIQISTSCPRVRSEWRKLAFAQCVICKSFINKYFLASFLQNAILLFHREHILLSG